MTNTENKRNFDDYSIYIKPQKRWEPVNKEFYEQYSRMNNTFRRRQQKHHACVCPREKWWLCDSDCVNCEYCKGGDMLSLDAPIGDDNGIDLGDEISSCDLSTEELTEKNIQHQMLMEALTQLEPSKRRVIELLLQDNSERTIVRILSLPHQSSVSYRKQQAINDLRKMMHAEK